MEIEIPTKQIQISIIKQIETDILSLFSKRKSELISDIIKNAKDIIEKNLKVASGNLSKGFEVEVNVGEKGFEVIVNNTAEAKQASGKYYWHIIETGRQAFSPTSGSFKNHMPPLEALRGWISERGITAFNEYQLRWSITKEGIKAQPMIIQRIRAQAFKDVKTFIGA